MRSQTHPVPQGDDRAARIASGSLPSRELQLFLFACGLGDRLATPRDAVDLEPRDRALGIRRRAFRTLGPRNALLRPGIQTGRRMFSALGLSIDQRLTVESQRRGFWAAPARRAIEIRQDTVVCCRTSLGIARRGCARDPVAQRRPAGRGDDLVEVDDGSATVLYTGSSVGGRGDPKQRGHARRACRPRPLGVSRTASEPGGRVPLAFLLKPLEGPGWQGERRCIRAGATLRTIEGLECAVRIHPAPQVIGRDAPINKANADGQDAGEGNAARKPTAGEIWAA